MLINTLEHCRKLHVPSAIFFLICFAGQACAQQLTQQEKGVMQFAGTCVAAADVGNEILRAKGKTSNMNDLIELAKTSIKILVDKDGATALYDTGYQIMYDNLQGQIGDTKTIFTMEILKECSRIYLSALPK